MPIAPSNADSPLARRHAQYDTYVQRLLIASLAVLIAGCGTTHCLPSAHRDEKPVIMVQNYGGFGPSWKVNITVAVYPDGTLLEWRENEQPSCLLLGARELRILSAIVERHHAVELLREYAAAGCCNAQDVPSVTWQIADKDYHLDYNPVGLLPLARDLDRFFRIYLGDRNYVTPFMELRAERLLW